MSLKSYTSNWIPANIRLPEGQILFAVGDAHGYLESLKSVVKTGLELEPESILIALGDLIDRGPDSLGCLKYMISTIAERGDKGIFLPGNHEAMMFAAIANINDMYPLWMHNGGRWIQKNVKDSDGKSILSYLEKEFSEKEMNILTAHGAFLDKDILKNNKKKSDGTLFKRFGNLIFIHAGVIGSNQITMEEWINNHDVFDIFGGIHPLWVREDFLFADAEKYNGDIIIHGHTNEFTIPDNQGNYPSIGVHEIKEHRLGLDGGSYNTGIVTGALFKNGFYKVITSERIDV